ncbi:MAG: SpoVG family protein [Fibrobacteraceae bacterium]|nr:SpoVG family protein [Fibrobacteraceae bacterium]
MPKNKTEYAAEQTAEKVTEFDCLVVTNVQVYPFKEGASMGKIKALARVVLNDQLQLTGLRVVDGSNGFFVGYPNDPFYKGEEYRSIFFPITKECREHIENCILEKYQEVVGAA